MWQTYLGCLAQLIWLGALAGCAAVATDTPADLPSLDAAAQARRYEIVEDTLEHNASGQPALWDAPGLRGSVIPLATVPSSTYGWCRDYEERIATSVRNYRLVGLACRDSKGQWLVLDMRPFIETEE
jgi:surface antigen